MKKSKILFPVLACMAVLGSCQDKDYDIAAPIISPLDSEQITGRLTDNDYVWSWPVTPECNMEVSLYSGSTFFGAETVDGNTYTHRNVDTNIEYTYVFRLSDGTNVSNGVVKRYTRAGASRISGISMSQIEKNNGYDAHVSWDVNESAESIRLTATDGSRTVAQTLRGDAVEYTISDVDFGEEWVVTLVAENADGASLPSTESLRIGKTAIGFLSIYPTPADLVADGDDDEASAWLWLHEEYPTAQYVYFGDIKSTADIDPFRVLFWMRDLEGVGEAEVFAMPQVVQGATPFVREWYAAGGNMLLWSHATVYAGALGRVDMDMLKSNDHAIGTGEGGFNGDTWSMAVSLNPGGKFTRDHSTHPIYKGLEVTDNGRCKLIAFKGAGWTEDHNCLFFNLPSVLTGMGNQDEACYTSLTEVYGIYPLGTWDSQIDFISQLNVWEARRGNTDFNGTLLCIGNGGCEFSLKNADGTPDKSAHPSNNPYQDNVLTLAKNSLEYLKTR